MASAQGAGVLIKSLHFMFWQRRPGSLILPSILPLLIYARRMTRWIGKPCGWSCRESFNFLASKLVRILRALHIDTKSAVRAYGRVSEEFEITTGFRQGDVLAPTLFNVFFDAVITSTLIRHPDCGVKLLDDELVGSWRKMRGSVLIQDLEYATTWLWSATPWLLWRRS